MSYDVFISYPSSLRRRADEADERLRAAGLVPYVAHRRMDEGDQWPSELAEALSKSEDLLVLWSEDATRTEWVRKEIDTFVALSGRRRHNAPLFVRHDKTDLPAQFVSDHQPDDLESALRALSRSMVRRLGDEIAALREDVATRESIINAELKTFLYKRFWQGFFDKPTQVHIFTCGRDVGTGSNAGRGSGGRTNIDFWDYQTVCDLHSFFARHNPQTHLEIAPPASKATDIPTGLSEVLSNTLRDKDCIIIGSPDVSDYAELVLAKLHRLDPWGQTKPKQRGFVILKPKGAVKTQSAIYRDARTESEEGVALVEGGEISTRYPIEEDREAKRGKTYGILTLALNPWQTNGEDSSVMILSGFTGIATNAVVQFLTDDEKYSQALYDLDRQIFESAADRTRPVEILMAVDYSLGDFWQVRDDRKIEEIRFVSHDFIEARQPG